MNDDIPELRLTPRMRLTLKRAAGIAREHGVDYLGTEHLILAILDDPAGIAGSAIRKLGFERALRDLVEGVLDSPGYKTPGSERP